jgi:integrase
MKAVINSTLLSQLKPSQKQYDIWDSRLTGFILRVNPNGNHVYRCEYARGKRITLGKANVLTPMQARDRALEILGEAAKGDDPQLLRKRKKCRTLEAFMQNEYKPWVETNRKDAAKTLARIHQCFVKPFGYKDLFEITPALIEQWRIQKLKLGRSAETVNRDIATFKAALSKAVLWGIIDKHPLTNLKLLKSDAAIKVRYLSREEEKNLRIALDKREEELRGARDRGNQWREQRGYNLLPNLIDQFADHLKPMIVLSLNTGVRQGELLNLTWQSVDFAAKVLTIEGRLSKSGKTRHVPLNKEAFTVLQHWKKSNNNNEDLVFPNDVGDKFYSVKKGWASILKLAQINNFRWHDMRHHFASRLVMTGVDLNTVRELLGHSDIKMTLRYVHLAPEHKAEAVARLVNFA